MKYIFVTGAPGSKWSSVVKNIYHSTSIDRSDFSAARTYSHDAPGEMTLMHMGSYFDPGMEFGDFFHKLDQYTKEQCEAEFDRPFSGTAVRIIKSHVFAHHLEFIKRTWPDCAIVLVYHDSVSCLDWWVKCGHFNITYPNYNSEYYRTQIQIGRNVENQALRQMSQNIENQNLDKISQIIKDQNREIEAGMNQFPGHDVHDNLELARVLALEPPPAEYWQNYAEADIKVKVI